MHNRSVAATRLPATTSPQISFEEEKKMIRNDENAISTRVYIHVRHNALSIYQLNKHTFDSFFGFFSSSSPAEYVSFRESKVEEMEELMTLILISDRSIKT